jgi:hypothetical protein
MSSAQRAVPESRSDRPVDRRGVIAVVADHSYAAWEGRLLMGCRAVDLDVRSRWLVGASGLGLMAAASARLRSSDMRLMRSHRGVD